MKVIRLVAIALITFSAACSDKNPVAPPPATTTTTRIMTLAGTLNLGSVQVGQSATASFIIRNDGNSPLAITGISGPCGSQYKSSFTSGTIASGTNQSVSVTFAPTAVANCSGNLTVAGNQTSGSNTIAVNAAGTLDGVAIFTKSGSGDTVFDLPTYITRVRIDANYGGFCQNFAVRIAGSLRVNIIMGSCSVADVGRTFSGTYALTAGGQVEITISPGINWTFTEVR